MSFADTLSACESFPLEDFFAAVTPAKVESVLHKSRLTLDDFLVLLSDPALRYLEPLAQKAAALTRKHFGNAILLFTPLYISNYCENRCSYCSFACTHAIDRRQLSPEEVDREAVAIRRAGIRHILVLTGEAPAKAGFGYLKECLGIIGRHFSAVGIEVYPLKEEEYGSLIGEGVIDSLTLYQETYNQALYRTLHRGGPKEDYRYRLEAPERACRRGIRALGIGALLGLDDIRREALALARHALYLRKTFPAVELSLSFPRIRPLIESFTPRFPVSDRRLAQCIIAFRLLFPTLGITMTTRESASFRNGVMPLGVTRVSAGVSTAVGGHIAASSTTQFEIADLRSVAEMAHDLLLSGFQPVLHDWNMKMSRC